MTAAASQPGANSRFEDTPAVPTSVGPRLRSKREGAGISIRALARLVGVSPSLVSQIENGRTNPSVGTLYALVSALGLSLDELFMVDVETGGVDHTGKAAPREGGPILRRARRPSVNLDIGVRWERLTPTADPEVDFLHVTYDVGAATCREDALMTHNGREYGLVLEGRLGATVGFESYTLEPGDSIVFDSPIPHRFWTIGDTPCVVVWTVVGRRGDPRSPGEAFEG